MSLGVLQRHESLAANLGAKLVGPLLLKSFDKIFDGDIKVVHSSFGLEQSPPTWLDLVTLSRSNPGDFILTDSMSGGQSCLVYLKGGQVQISEDDYRLIMSGAPERMIPNQPIPEDEAAELGTLGILEARLAVLIKKADVVASKARQLNYHLGKHKTAVQTRPTSTNGNNNVHHHPIAFGQSSPGRHTHSPLPLSGDTNKLQQDLLRQFTANDNRPSSAYQAHKPAHPSLSNNQDPARARSSSNNPADNRRESSTLPSPLPRDDYRALMTSKVEKLPRGDPIKPPCDRCRRLKFDCTKNLTACTACTKKHAKCSWNDLTEEEVNMLQRRANGGMEAVGNITPVANMGANVNVNLDPNLAAVLADQEFSGHTMAIAQMEGVGGP